MTDTYVTVRQIAEAWGYSMKAARRLVLGYIPHHRLPSVRSELKVLRADAIAFAKANHLPYDRLATGQVFLATQDNELADRVIWAFVKVGQQTEVADSWFEAGSMLAACSFRIAVVDCSLDTAAALNTLRWLAENKAGTKLVGVRNEDGTPTGHLESVTQWVERETNWRALAKEIA